MIYALVGPTASGKTDVAIELARRLDAEIINFDAYQVYKELNIGTAKPSEKELAGIKNHLFSCVSIKDNFNICVFQKMCREIIDDLCKKNKNIILVGGSGLYLRSVIYDYSFQEETVKFNTSKYNDLSNDELYKRLVALDEVSAQKIHPNNKKRVIRALLIAENSEFTKSEVESKQDHKLIYDVKIIGLNPPRDILYENINKRVDWMFENGLVEEIQSIYKEYDKNLNSLQAIGYKEFTLNLSLDETKELIKKNTRNYAKRQITFFKHQFENIEWFDSGNSALKNIK